VSGTFDEGRKTALAGLLHLAFIVAVAVKGIRRAYRGLAGLAIAILGTREFTISYIQLTAPELDLHPESRTVNLIRHGASSLAARLQPLGHLLAACSRHLETVLAIELLREKRGYFPWPLQSCRFCHLQWRTSCPFHWSPWLLALALFRFYYGRPCAQRVALAPRRERIVCLPYPKFLLGSRGREDRG